MPFLVSAQKFERGAIIDTLFCDANPSQSYALYLPSNYSEEKSWPIIYIFDPAARGTLPLKIFKMAAEELGYILVCSNNSKNGSWSVVFESARAIKKDTELKFSIDKNRVYTSGFSGGSRAAMVMAKSVYNARGIIANAGAYPSKSRYLIKREDSIAYAAIVGNRDMNYLEHKQMARSLTDQQVDNMLIISNNVHQWASSREVYLALQWLELKTDKKLQSNRKEKILENVTIWGDSVLIQPEYMNSLPLLHQLGHEYQLSFSKSPFELLESKTVQKQLKTQRKAEAREEQALKKYMGAIATLPQTKFDPKLDSIHTVNWWKTEIDRLKKKEGSEKYDVSRSAIRLSNYIWASFAELSFSYESKGNFEFALELNELWQYAQPKSIWANYSCAKIYAKSGDQVAAIKALYRAQALGMSKKLSLINEPVFDQLQDMEEYQVLLTLLE